MKKMIEELPVCGEQVLLEKAIEDEMAAMIFDHPEVASTVLQKTTRLCEMLHEEEDDTEKVLQTRIVSPVEVKRKPEA